MKQESLEQYLLFLGFERQGRHKKRPEVIVWANTASTPHLVIELQEEEVRSMRDVLVAIWQAGRTAQAESTFHEWQKLERTFRAGREVSDPGPFGPEPLTSPPA